MKEWITLLVCLYGSSLASDEQFDGVATIVPTSTIDVTGTIEFKFTESDKSIYVDVDFNSDEDYGVKIHQFLADNGRAEACGMVGEVWDPTDMGEEFCSNAVDCVGGDLHGLYGSLSEINYGKDTPVTDSWNIGDSDQVVGRSIVLTNGGNVVACFPILPVGEGVKFYRSKITEKANVWGEVTLIRATLSTDAFIFFSNSFIERDGGRELYSLQIGTQDLQVQGSCDDDSNYVDLRNWGYTNNGDDMHNHNTITNGGNPMLTDTGTTPTSVQIRDWDRTTELFPVNQDHERTCAPVYEIHAKSAYAWIYQDGVNARIEFSQESPYHPVHISTTSDAGATKFMISEFGVPRFENMYVTYSESCSVLWHHVESHSIHIPAEALSGTTYATSSITLYGHHSIIGHAAAFQSVGDTSFCGNIQSSADVVRLIADFHGALGGSLVLEQDASNPWDDTTIYNGLYATTTNYTDQVELFINNLYNDELMVGVSRCASSLDIYYGEGDTGSLLDDENSDTPCANPDFPYKCKRGITSSRLGHLHVQTIDNPVNLVHIQTDAYMALSGGYKIPSSLLIRHTVNDTVGSINFDCAMLKNVGGISARAEVIRYSDTSEASKVYSVYNTAFKIDMLYSTDKNEMTLDVDFDPILSLTEALELRSFPVPTSFGGYPYLACNHATLGPLINYNHGEVEGEASLLMSGDLSGQFELFKDGATVVKSSALRLKHYDFFSKQYTPLYRSVRLGYGHKDDDYVCANLNPVLTNDQTQTELYALFHGPNTFVEGEIKFAQVTVHTDSGEYYLPTNVQYYLTHVEHPHWVTDTHRIYITKYSSCDKLPYREVDLANDLYNPYGVVHQFTNNGEFPHFSQVGDITAKSGVYTAVGKREFMNVANVPLSGAFSIRGKAVVITDSLTKSYLGCSVITSEQLNSAAHATVGVLTTMSVVLLALLQ